MSGHKSILSNFVSYPTLIVLFLFTAGLAGAQTPIATIDKSRVEATPTQPESGASLKGTPTSSEADTPKAIADPVAAEADLMNAQVEAPKVQPQASPRPLPGVLPGPMPLPAQCKRMIKADVVAMPKGIMLNR